jgi:hypothetical protein
MLQELATARQIAILFHLGISLFSVSGGSPSTAVRIFHHSSGFATVSEVQRQAQLGRLS